MRKERKSLHGDDPGRDGGWLLGTLPWGPFRMTEGGMTVGPNGPLLQE